MAKMKGFKEIREEVAKLEAVKNRESFAAALPLLAELSAKLTATRKTVKRMEPILAALNESVTAYALDHRSVFMGGQLNMDGKGVEHGDVDLDGVIYHFSHGYEGYKRLDGQNMTRDFLSGLPEGWTKTETKIDTTGINKANPNAKDLAAAGLIEKPKDVWTLQESQLVDYGE